MVSNIQMGLTLQQISKALGKRLHESGVIALHPDLHPRKLYRAKKKGTIQSVGAKKAMWHRSVEEFDLGQFDSDTEYLISTLIELTTNALKTKNRSELESFIKVLLAADAGQMPIPTGPPRVRAGVHIRRALAQQVKIDYLRTTSAAPFNPTTIADSAIADAEAAVKILEQDNEPGRDDCLIRAEMIYVSLIHRHKRGELGPEKYAKLLADKKMIERLWASLKSMRWGHPRAEVTARNLTNLCSLLTRQDTRDAYIHLVAIEGHYIDLTHKAVTALETMQTDSDCKYLRAVLEANPVTSQEIAHRRFVLETKSAFSKEV